MAVSVVRALPSTLLPTTINVLCTILKNSTTLVLTRCPWTWPTSFKAWKPSKDWSRFEPPTLFGWEFHRSTNLHQSIYPYWKKVSQILTVTLVRISKRLKKKTMKSRFLKTENWKNTKFHEKMKPEFWLTYENSTANIRMKKFCIIPLKFFCQIAELFNSGDSKQISCKKILHRHFGALHLSALASGAT